MPFEPIVPEGQHLGTSHEVSGAVTGHLFEDGTNELKGHAAWHRVDEPTTRYPPGYECEPPRELTQEEREPAHAIAGLILLGTVRAIGAATPLVVTWWNRTAVPTVKSAWKRVAGRRKVNAPIAAVAPSSERQATPFTATEAEVAIRESKTSMSRAEWEYRLRVMLAAGAFKEEQQRILSSARIDDDGVLDARGAMEQMTAQQFGDRIKLMLEANPSLLDEETFAELTRALGVQPQTSYDPSKLELEK